MTPLIQLWIASSAGATIFFSVGFLLARALDRAEQGLAQAYLTRLSDGLAQARAECVRLDKELAGRAILSERSSLLELENRRLQETAQAGAEWEARSLELEVKRTQTAESRHAALSQELERLRKEQHESAERVQLLATRAARLDAQEKDNAQLKKQCATLSNQLHRLRQSLSEASASAPSLAPASGRAVVVPPAARSAPEPFSPSEQGLQAILLRQLSILMLREPNVTAVLSDAHGLPLAGLGPARDQERVSALTSIARGLAARSRELVGFQRVDSLEIAESGGRTLRVRFFNWMDQPLALGYLGAGGLLHSEAEERMVSSFPPLQLVRSA